MNDLYIEIVIVVEFVINLSNKMYMYLIVIPDDTMLLFSP